MHKQIDDSIDKDTRAKLQKKHSWIKKYSEDIENYIPSNYYDSLLKEYTTGGKSELEIFSEYLEKRNVSNYNSVLELGCGSGRATDIFLAANIPYNKLDLVDLSPDMVSHMKEAHKNATAINIHTDDNINFLSKTNTLYDFVYSLWSLSHSIHQHMVDDGFEKAKDYVMNTLKDFISNRMSPGADFFLIHFDSKSEEQTILMNQWKKNFSIFDQGDKQSPSKQLLDSVLQDLEVKTITDLQITYYRGDPIRYASLEELLEIFLNFHMETEYNRSKNLEKIIEEISKDAEPYKQKDSTYSVGTGFFIYTFKKK